MKQTFEAKAVYRHPDLHIHSCFSDGTDDPRSLIAAVKAAGVDLFALTDHDSYAGCAAVQALLTQEDPRFVGGVELSCEDATGKYHILGYCYDVNKPSVREAIRRTHGARRRKAEGRIRYIREVCGFEITKEEEERILENQNPGKPHFVAFLLKKGYIKEKEEGFALMAGYKGEEQKLTPEEAIEAILEADGIPVLAHGIFAEGGKLLSPEETENRVARLKPMGLMGLECYYSGYTEEQKQVMLALAEKYNLLITAGSDYHGKNKTVALGETKDPDPERMKRFYRAVERLLTER